MKKTIQAIIFAVLNLSFIAPSYGALWGELDGFYNTDSFVTAANSTSSKMFYSADFFANLNSDANLYAGFHVHQLSTTSQATGATSDTFSTMDMGPMFMWVIDQKRNYSFSIAYNIVAKGTDSATTDSTLDGTSFLIGLGVTPEIYDGWYIGFKLNYYSATFNKSTVSTTVSDVSYTRTMIFPTISISYRK